MGALGEDLKTQVENLIEDPNLRSSATVHSFSFTEGDYGGYATGTSTITSSTAIYVIPSNYVQSRTGLQMYGDLQEGDLRLLIKDSISVDAFNDVVSFSGETYVVREIRPIFFNEVTVAKAIILTRDAKFIDETFPNSFPINLS